MTNPIRTYAGLGVALLVTTAGLTAALAAREAHEAKHVREYDNAAQVLFAETWKGLTAAEHAIACKIFEGDTTGLQEGWRERGATPAAIDTITELFAQRCSLEA